MNSILGIDPDTAGLAQAASVIGQLSGPQRMPVGIGSILGQAAGGINQARSQAMMQQGQLQQLKDASDAKQAAVAEQQREVKARNDFNSILGQMQSSGQPMDDISILGAGVQSGAFKPNDVTNFMSKVLEKRAAREQRLEELRIKAEDKAISEEEKKAAQLQRDKEMQQFRQDNIRLAAAMRPKNLQITSDKDGNQFIVEADGKTRPLMGPDGKQLTVVPKSGAKPPAEIMRMNIALGAMDKALDSYEELLSRFNPRSLANMKPSQRAEAKSLIGALQLEWKEAAALGALTGPDLEMMEKTIVDPASSMGVYYGTEGLGKQVKQGRDYIKRRRDSIRKFYPNVDSDDKKDPWE